MYTDDLVVSWREDRPRESYGRGTSDVGREKLQKVLTSPVWPS